MRQCVVLSLLFCVISKVLALPRVKEPCLLLKSVGLYIQEGTVVYCECEDVDPAVEAIFWESTKLGILERANASLENSTYMNLTLSDINDGDVIKCCSTDGRVDFFGGFFPTLVAYGPRSVTLTTSPAPVVLDNCPLCNGTIRVTCLPHNLSPMGSIITIYKNGIDVYNGTNTTTSLTVSSGGSLVIACDARNAMIPTLVSSERTVVEIREVPPTAPVMLVDGRNTDVFTSEENESISIMCRINGGYPLVDNTTVQCGHLPGLTTSGSVANYSVYVTRDLNQAVCRCDGSHVTGTYNRTASLVLDVLYAASITSFTINNHTSSPNVSDNTPVYFSCEADGNPTPSIAIISANGNELLQTGPSPLNFTTILPCDGLSAFICQANTSVGTPATSVVNITMLCMNMKEPQPLDPMPIIVGVAVPAGTILIAIVVLVCIIRNKKSRPSDPEPEPTECTSDNNTITGSGGTHLSGSYNNILARGSQSTINPYATFDTDTMLKEEASDPPEDYSCWYNSTTDPVLDNAEVSDSNAKDKQSDSNAEEPSVEIILRLPVVTNPKNVEEPSVEIIPRVPVVTNPKNIEEASFANSRNKPPSLPQKLRPRIESSDTLRSDESPYKVPCTSTREASCNSTQLVP